MCEWINIKKRFPTENKRFYVSDGKKIYIASLNQFVHMPNGNIEIPANYGNGAVVKYWMPSPAELPLPKPPEED